MDRRLAASLVGVAALLAGCASGDEGGGGLRVESCADRLLSRATSPAGRDDQAARRYVVSTYCAPFAWRGWVYEDGALSIAAHEWLEASGSEACATSRPGEPARTVPCETLESAVEPRRLGCALLRHVRRSEIRVYLRQLGHARPVECDDGTPLAELGVP